VVYDLFKFLHVVAAVVWVGSGVGLVALTLTMAKDRAAIGAVMPHLERLGPRLFGPASGAALIFGVITVLTSDGRWEFTDPWILIGFAGFALSGVVTMLATPRQKRLGELAAEKGPDHPDVAAGALQIINMRRIDLLILVVVIADMVFKPGAAG
jgi:uncharacterized membrane protein